MEFPVDKTLVLFDGYCHLCNTAVNIILRFDKRKKFLFSPLSGPTGTYYKARFSIPNTIDSIVVIHKNEEYLQAEAALLIAKRFGGIFHVFRIFYGIPKTYRKQLYNWVASHRYKWFGRYESCTVPRPEFKDRFI